MLDKHLRVKTYGKSDSANVILWNDYRVTVLDIGLFRIEQSNGHIWRDDATQSIWYRNAHKQNFTVTHSDTECVIETAHAVLILRKEFKQCRIVLDGREIPLDNTENLFGTYRTLDNCDGDEEHSDWHSDAPVKAKIQLGAGVCSKSGVAVIDDSNSLTLGDDGMIKPMRADGIDIYVFAYGHDYRAAVKALYSITGTPPLLPRYALGNWWSRYYVYTDKSYLTLLDKFVQKDIPLTVATIDMDWHYSNDLDAEFHITEQGRDTEFYGGTSGWTGYSWNKHLFPDYKAFLKKIQDRNLNITLNVHPADGVRWFEDCYNDMALAMGIDAASGQKIAFDITDDRFINNYFSVVHKPYEKDGVKFWWIDWQQGNTSNVDGLDPLWSLNHYHYLDIAKEGDDPIILSRYAGVGSHRYPIGFSGDTYNTWKTLKYLAYFTCTASNIGYTWWSHDIGGHMWGRTDGELYLRSVQYGVFSPINRLHCSAMKGITKEPWFFRNGTGEIAQEYLKLRHAMIPFLYTANNNTHENGVALIEPIYYDHADNDYAYEYQDKEYLFGGLIVAPVTEPIETDGFARVSMWLPEGKYTDIFTKDEYNVTEISGKCVTLLRRLESIPVLAKAGTFLPLSLDKGNKVDNPKILEIKAYSGNGKYTLYEDKNSGKSGKYFTEFSMTEDDNDIVILDIVGNGDADVIPKNRKLRIVFENIRNGKAELFVNGKKTRIEDEYFDNLTVTVNYKAGNSYKIFATDLNTSLDNLFLRITDILTAAEEPIAVKDTFYNAVKMLKTPDEIIEHLAKSELSDATKLKIKETIGQ